MAVRKDAEFVVPVRVDDGSTEPLKKMSAEAARAGSAFSRLQADVISLNQAFELAKKVLGGIGSALKAAPAAYLEANRATKRLSATLTILGEKNVPKVVESYQAFADQLQRTTKFEGDNVVRLLQVARAAGVADKQAQELVMTAADVASAFGEDIDGAFQTLLASLKGSTRGVASYLPQLAGLSQEAGKAGVAIKVLGERFAGFAKKDASEFEGALARLQNNIGDAVEEIGKIIVEGLDLTSITRSAADFAASVVDAIKRLQQDVIPILKDVSAATQTLGRALANVKWAEVARSVLILTAAFAAFYAVHQTAALVAAVNAIGGLSAAIAAMGGLTGIMIQIKAFFAGSAFIQGAKAMALASVKFLAVGASLLVIAAGIDIVVRNFSKMDQILAIVGGAVEGFVNKAGQGFRRLFLGVNKGVLFATEALNKLGLVGDDAVVDRMKAVQTVMSDLADLKGQEAEIGKTIAEASQGIDTGFLGQGIQFVKDLLGGAKEEAEDLNKELGKKGNGKGGGIGAQTQEAKKALEELARLVDEIQSKQLVGLTFEDTIRMEAAEQFKKLNAVEEELKAQKALTKEAEKQLEAGRAAAAAALQANLKGSGDVTSDEATEQTLKLAAAASEIGRDEVETLELKFQEELRLLGLKEQTLRKEEDIHAAALAQIPAQRELLKIINEKQKAALGTEEQRAGKAAGEALSKPIVEAVQGSAAGFAASFAGAVMPQVAALQAVVDAVPAMLDAITKLVDSVTDLPMKIAEGVVKLFDAVDRFIDEFIPKLFQAITMIVERVVKFIEELPDRIFDLMEKIPKLVEDLLEKLPRLIDRMVAGLIAAAPEIAAALVDSLLFQGGLERIVGALLRAVPRIAIALVNGIVNGLKRSLGAILNIKAPKGLGKDIAKEAQKFVKAVGKDTSKLFAVKDLQDDFKAMIDPAAAFGNAIDEFQKKAFSIWQALKDAWMWIKQNIIDPLINGLKAVWDFVFQMLRNLWEILRFVWLGVYNNVIKPMLDGLKAVWDFVWNTILKPYIEALKTVWNFVVETIGKFPEAVRAVFMWVKEVLFDKYVALVKEAFSGILDFFQNLFKGRVDEAFKGLLDTFNRMTAIVKEAFKPVTDLFASIGATVASAFRPVTDLFANLGATVSNAFSGIAGIGTQIWERLRDGVSNGLSSVLTNVINALNPGNLFSRMFDASGAWGKGTVEKALNIDVPFLNFATGGMVPGSAAVRGDSEANDKVLAMLSPGEAIIPRSAMARPGVASLVEALISGGGIPKFATGGVLGQIIETGGGFFDQLGAIGGLVKNALGGAAATIKGSITGPAWESLVTAIGGGFDPRAASFGDIAGVVGGMNDALMVFRALGKTLSDVGGAGFSAAIGAVREVEKGARSAGDAVQNLKAFIDPRELWKIVKEMAFTSVTQMFDRNAFASGGTVGGMDTGGDSVMARLRPGEEVIRRESAAPNRALLKAINAAEGPVSLGGGGGGSVVVQKIEIHARTDLTPEAIRREIVPEIERELRRKSQDGRRILDPAGVRS